MRLPRGSYGVLLVITLAMVLGHICALPFHAHAGAITTHEEGQSHHGAGDSDEGAMHVGSCDVVKSAPSGIDGAMLVSLGAVVTAASAPTRHVAEAGAAVVVGGPPLFLLHASLLI